jgi:alanyl-tRNA synthetase
MNSNQLRQLFLSFFEEKGHRVLPSASLIPDDPTLLLTIAGMVPFKPFFLGKKEPLYPRVCTVQKCVRVSDLDKVGFTRRHHTFFEMLGNFSFGDYFKKEACIFAWEFLVHRLKLSEEKLWVSVHEKDEEAFHIWKDVVGVPEEKIVLLGDEDNFWASGPVGPCGYCSEIYFDFGERLSCGKPECKPGCDCDRYLEVWNLVFMEFDRQSDGSLRELPRKNIDTGMGLERIASVVQGVDSNFETDLFLPIIEELKKRSGLDYHSSTLPFFRVVADHVRAVTFLIADGIFPSNEGRGYVLRRLIRRAYRYGRKLGLEKPFLYELVFKVIEIMRDFYPELVDKSRLISQVVFQEEEKFDLTLKSGLSLLEEMVSKARKEGLKTVSGREIFKLYDTYGFPADVAREVLQEEGLDYSDEEFKQEMEAQRLRGKKAFQEKEQALRDYKALEEALGSFKSEFTGYDSLEGESKILVLLSKEGFCDQAAQGEEVFLVLERTPFYPEKGGQEWDTGFIIAPQGLARINRVFLVGESCIVHQGRVERGRLQAGEVVVARVDSRRRRMLAIHHTCTHLLHRALRNLLGEQVKQAGSWVGEQGLRFDFAHFAPLTEEEIKAVEAEVNAKIFEDLPVVVSYTTLEEARRSGVIALFDEKYQKEVRVVRVLGYSAELCGGTHLTRTAQAGLFRIISEGSIGSGIRRIEAVAGPLALERFQKDAQLVKSLKEAVEIDESQLLDKVQGLLEENKQLKKELTQFKRQATVDLVRQKILESKERVFSHLFSDASLDIETLRPVFDELRDQPLSRVVVLGMEKEGRVQGLVGTTGQLVRNLDLKKLVKEALKVSGGGGGGRPHLVQFGGVPRDKWAAFVEELCRLVNRESPE